MKTSKDTQSCRRAWTLGVEVPIMMYMLRFELERKKDSRRNVCINKKANGSEEVTLGKQGNTTLGLWTS